MKVKRLFAGLLSAVMLMTLLPVGAAAAAEQPIGRAPDVFQGDGMYITATPWEIKNNTEGWTFPDGHTDIYNGYIAVERKEQAKDDHGYYTGSLITYVNFVDLDGNLLWDEAPQKGARMAALTDGYHFSEGLVGYYDSETGLCGYMDVGGQVVIPARYEMVEAFHEGLAQVRLDGMEYFIDQTGTIVLGPFEGKLGHFSNGLVNCEVYLDADRQDYFVGFLDKQGQPAITIYRGSYGDYSTDEYLDLSWEAWGAFSEDGYAALYDYRGGRMHPATVIIDTSGAQVHVFDLPAPSYFYGGGKVSEGLILLGGWSPEGSFYRLYDVHGNLKLSSETTPALVSGSGGEEVRNGVLPCADGLIDTEGRTIISQSHLRDVAGKIFVGLEWISSFDNGASLMTMTYSFHKDYYLLEIHEGTYHGSGIVYDAVTGQITGGGSTPTDPETPTEPAGDTPSSWAVENVNTAVEAGIVPETLQSAYTQATTRAEFCALAVELYETVMGTEITERATFSDTTDVNVEKMAGLGVVNGVGDGKFDPSASLTREEAATMLSRLANVMEKPLTAGTASFADNASISSWASEAVGQVQASGIMNGIEGNQFAPSDPYTREQSIVTMLRLYDFVK